MCQTIAGVLAWRRRSRTSESGCSTRSSNARLEADTLDKLSRRVKTLTDPKKDRVRIYRFYLNCEREIEIQGAGKVTEDPDLYVL